VAKVNKAQPQSKEPSPDEVTPIAPAKSRGSGPPTKPKQTASVLKGRKGGGVETLKDAKKRAAKEANKSRDGKSKGALKVAKKTKEARDTKP
jgi:hypothetical protein